MLLGVSQHDGRRAIAVADLRTGKHTILFPGARAYYTASGHILYSTVDNKLFAVPFDAASLEDIIRSKEAADRVQDRQDVIVLREMLRRRP